MRKAVLFGAILVVSLVAIAALVASFQKPGPLNGLTTSSSTSSTTSDTSVMGVHGGPIIVGVEYGQMGLAASFAQLGISGAKYLPATFPWDKMQSSNGSAINFALMDAFVKEYQDAGFTQLVMGLKSQSHWASMDFNTNPTPKHEYQGEYQRWVNSVVERYDDDGVDDMPGLRFPVRYYEVGVEFSSYEPESVGDYLSMLSLAHSAAHAAFPGVVVLNAAFLVTTAFDTNPAPEQYATAFAAVDPRIMYHSLSDIQQVLDRPDLFDAVDFHALGNAYEITSTVNWLNYEMGQRGYTKPIVIGDTAPSPLASWGPATTCDRSASQMAIMILPAMAADRCRLADFFKQLIAGNETDLAWAETFATDMVQKVVVSAGDNVTLIDTSFMEDLPLMTSSLFQAAAGLSAWEGMAQTTVNLFTQAHAVQGLRPSFYAIKQLMTHINNYTAFTRVATNDSSVYLYRVVKDGKSTWIAWYDHARLFLPGDQAPTKSVHLEVGVSSVDVEPLVSQPGQTQPSVTTVATAGGVVALTLSQVPVFIYAP